MKAIVITAFGEPAVLEVQDREIPAVGAGEVLLRVYSAGVNRPDIFQRKGHYAAPAGVVADIPGLEVAGEVVAVGADVSCWKVGDRLCALVAGGGYAEYVAVDRRHCFAIPGSLSYAAASTLPETCLTVWDNMVRRGGLKAGERILIHGGAGGIGSTAIQFAKLLGAEVVTTCSTARKAAYCKGLGADMVIRYREHDFEDLLRAEGVDVILDCIGGDYFAKNINILREDGRLVYINAMEGAKVSLNIFKLMQKRIVLTGSTLRARDAAFKADLVASFVAGGLPFIERGAFKTQLDRSFALSEAPSAHQLMEDGNFLGKIALAL